MKSATNSTRAAEINAALLPAYANASKLKMSKAEIKKLTKAFQQEQIEIRPDGAIFIPHIFISQRLNEVFAPGGWSLICREHYLEEDACEIQAEYILIVRGCFIGEEVGEQAFNQVSDKYSDALACIAAKALRRICGLKFSCGNQLWQPVFVEKWKAKFAESYRDGEELVWRKKGKEALSELSETAQPRNKKSKVDDDMRHVMLQCLSTQGNDNVLKYALEKKILKKGETLNDWPLKKVAVGERAIRELQNEIQKFFNPEPNIKSWRDVPMPFGSMKGKKLGELDKEVVAGYFDGIDQLKGHDDFKTAMKEAAAHFNITDMKPRK